MRPLLVPLIAAVLMAGIASAQAEKRTFIIANNADGYGIDRCLATGQKCGAAMARVFCQSREYTRALSYRKAGRGEIAGAVPPGPYACSGSRCEEFVAIECTR